MSFHTQLLQQTEQARMGLLSAPIIQGCLRGEVSLPSYVAFLTEAYHHVKHTVPLLQACQAALPAHHAWLAPALEDPRRGTYLRWSFFAPSVIEPAVMAKNSGWEVKEMAAGWGNFESMIASAESAIAAGPYLLGEQFSMADVVFGGTLRFMMGFKQIEPRPAFTDYVARLDARPAFQRADARNLQMRKQLGLQ